MARKPEDRYDTAGAFARDLRAFLSDGPVKIEAHDAWKSQEDSRNTIAFVVSGVIGLILLTTAVVSSVTRATDDSARRIAELKGQVEDLRKSVRDPTAATPGLDSSLGEAVEIADPDREQARRYLGDLRQFANTTLNRSTNAATVTDEAQRQSREKTAEARASFEQGDLTRAAILADEALRTDPRSLDVIRLKAEIAAESGELDRAGELFTVLLMHPETAEADKDALRLARAKVFAEYAEAHLDALAEQEFARITGPKSWQATRELVQLHVLRQRFVLAFACLETFLKRIRESGAISQGFLTKDEVARLTLLKAELMLKLGQPLDGAEALTRDARELAESEDVRAAIGDVQYSIAEARKASEKKG